MSQSNKEGDVNERPILFSGEMVRAILEGRKTQTRRVVKAAVSSALEYFGSEDIPPIVKYSDEGHSGPGWYIHSEEYPDEGSVQAICPYGAPGSKLWVRETWGQHACPQHDMGQPPGTLCLCLRAGTVYRADREMGIRWRPSIHMPRWASRITLEVTGVRVERLQDISEEDAKAEGLKAITKDGRLVKYGIPDRDGLPGTDDDGWEWHEWSADPREAFRRLWNTIHTERHERWFTRGESEDVRSPWVWVVEFRRVEAKQKAA